MSTGNFVMVGQQHVPYRVYFAGWPILWAWAHSCGNNNNDDGEVVVWYKGGRPENSSCPLDIWAWGGLSLLTDRVLQKQNVARGLAFLCLCIFVFFSRPRWKWFLLLLPLVATLLLVGSFIWRVVTVRRMVQEEMAPTLFSMGLTIECYQWPWFSYYVIRPVANISSCSTDPETVAPNTGHVSSILLEDKELVRTVNPSHDWQGYSLILEDACHWKNVWSLGAFVETARGRVRQAERTSPPLLEIRHRRQMQTLGHVAFMVFFALMHLDLYYLDYYLPANPTRDTVLSVLELLFAVGALVALCRSNSCQEPIVWAQPLNDIIQETAQEFSPEIQKRTGYRIEMEDRQIPAFVKISKLNGNDGSYQVL